MQRCLYFKTKQSVFNGSINIYLYIYSTNKKSKTSQEEFGLQVPHV